jgi:hypothetical protein
MKLKRIQATRPGYGLQKINSKALLEAGFTLTFFEPLVSDSDEPLAAFKSN